MAARILNERFNSGVAPVVPDARGAALESMSIADSLTRFDEKVRPAIDTMQLTQQAPGIQAEVMGGGDFAPNLGITPLQRARNEVAQRAYADRTKIDLANEVANLHAKYQGHNPDDADNFSRELEAYARPKLAAIPEQFRMGVERDFEMQRAADVSRLKEASADQAFRNDINDIKAAALKDAETLMLAARDGDAGALERATVSIHDRYASLVDKGVIGPEVANAEAAGLVEKVAAEAMYGQFLRGNGPSLEDVQAGRGEAGLLSLDARDSLARQMQAELAHRRSEQNHAIAMGEKVRAQGDRDLNALTARFKLGIPPSPDELARLNGYASGAIPATPLQVEEAKAAYRGITMNAEVATATPEQITATMAQMAANPPQSVEEALVRKDLSEALSRRERMLRDDPIAYAQSVLPDKYPTIALPSDPGSPQFDDALKALSDQADLARAQWGVDTVALTKPDQQRLATMLAQLPADQKALVRGKVEANMGPNTLGVWEALSKEGATVQAHAGILSAQGRGDIASSIEQGKQALDLKTVKLPTPEETAKEFIGSGIPEAFYYSPQAQAQIRDAAHARAAYLAMMAGESDNVSKHLPQAYKDVGGATGDYRGKKVALPIGLDDEGEFADRVESVTDSEIAAMGGNVGHLGPIADAIRSGNARLESIGEGRYFVTIGTARALDAAGRPFVLDYSKIAEKSPAAPAPFRAAVR